MDDVKIIKNFVDEKDIVFLTQYINNNYMNTDKFKHRTGVAFNKGLAARAIFPDEKPASMFKELENVIGKYSNKFIKECKNLFSDNRDILFYGVSITRLGKDIQIRIHQDIHNDFVDLIYSGILYLNDNYDGGELVFLNDYIVKDEDYLIYPGTNKKILFPIYKDELGGLIYKPQKGDMVIFPSLKYHGGKMVINGNRDSIILWSTLNKEYEFEGFDSNRVIGDGSGYTR